MRRAGGRTSGIDSLLVSWCSLGANSEIFDKVSETFDIVIVTMLPLRPFDSSAQQQHIKTFDGSRRAGTRGAGIDAEERGIWRPRLVLPCPAPLLPEKVPKVSRFPRTNRVARAETSPQPRFVSLLSNPLGQSSTLAIRAPPLLRGEGRDDGTAHAQALYALFCNQPQSKIRVKDGQALLA